MKKITPQERYDAANIVRLSMKLNKKTDADVLQRLGEVESKQGYVKQLIRADIERSSFMTDIKAANITVNGHQFDYQLINGTLLHSSEWNGEKYIVNVGQLEKSYVPVYSEEPNENGGFDIVGFE